MSKCKIKKYSIFVVVALAIAASLYYAFGEFYGSSLRVRSNLLFHKTEYSELAQKFLKQDRIKNIAFNAGSEIINQCSSNQLGSWSCATGGYSEYSRISLADIDAVLNYLDLPKEEYSYYVKFIRKYKLNSLGRDNDKSYIEMEDKLDGLRYYERGNMADFVEDKEYLSVKKIDEHWFWYYRDWN